jgi:hypothetical protein
MVAGSEPKAHPPVAETPAASTVIINFIHPLSPAR